MNIESVHRPRLTTKGTFGGILTRYRMYPEIMPANTILRLADDQSVELISITHCVRPESLPRLIVKEVKRLKRVCNFMAVIVLDRHVYRDNPGRDKQ